MSEDDRIDTHAGSIVKVTKVGRPTKYRKEMCDQVIELGKEGASLHEIAYELDICFDTLNEWKKEKPEFSEAISRAQKLSQGWWEKSGRKAVFGEQKFFSAQGYSLQMRNRFPDDWRDKQDFNVAGNVGDMILEAREREKKLRASLDKAEPSD